MILAARIAHRLIYIADHAGLRSPVRCVGFGCTLALTVMAALDVA